LPRRSPQDEAGELTFRLSEGVFIARRADA